MTLNQALDTTFFALSDATRRAILARLASGDATVGEIAAPYAMSLAAVSKHLKVLEEAGLISRTREAQWHRIHLEAKPLRTATRWLGDYERFWTKNADSLGRYLATLQKRNDKPRRKKQ
jgi:DNA-binding transcriptional ArsR family regulator